MSGHRTTNSAREEQRKQTSHRNKQNNVSDTVFLIQNENQVLRMKNTQLNTKIKQLKIQLQTHSDSIALQEKQIDNIKVSIEGTTYKEDIQIENEKKLLTEKLTILKSNEEIVLRKIKEARQATISEEQKVAAIQNDKKVIEVQILSLKAQNEGTRIVLQNLQDQNERLRAQNEVLISKRKVYEPLEKEVSFEIEERIRFIKSQQQQLKNLKKNETCKLIYSGLKIIYHSKLREHFSKIDRYSLLRKLAQKKMVQMFLIQKKYIQSIKHNILLKFRDKFNPLQEQQAVKRILAETHKRRVKAFIWRKWRTATKNAQFTTARRFQFHNTIQKIAQAWSKTNLYAAFNMLKHFKNNPFHQKAIKVIDNIWNNFMKRYQTHFFSALRSAQANLEINQEIQASSKEQSELLVTSLYFTAWVKLAKSHGIENKSILRRYFKQLKKLVFLRRRRRLGQILTQTNQRLKNVDTNSKTFTVMKKTMMSSKIVNLGEEQQAFKQKRQTLKEELDQMHLDKKYLYQQLALLKISKYLKTKMQKAFDVWRLRKQQSKVILTIINMVESKKSFDKNFGFAQILKKRFAMLKKSINDKIAGCEFSYNYLLDQNKHIKEVLDKKQHELEKNKFMNILKKICKNQKEAKLKYFYKFMRCGFKFWKFRKVCHRVDQMAEKKIKMVFLWLLKVDQRQIKQQNRIQTFLQKRDKIMAQRYYHKVINAFRINKDRVKRLKRVISGVFQRNLQLDFYAAFGKIRNEEHIYYRSLIQADIDDYQGHIDQVESVIKGQENKIETLKERLKDKQDILEERKILGLYQFFVKNIKTKFRKYLRMWRDRVKEEDRVYDFAEIYERKSRIMLKNKFSQNLTKKDDDMMLEDLQNKHQRFQAQFDRLAESQQAFLRQNENESARMRTENDYFKKEGGIYQKRTETMTKIKINSFLKAWGKKMLRFSFREWRGQTDNFLNTWSHIDQRLGLRVKRQTFTYFVKEMREQLEKDRLRNNLDKIYTNMWRFNAGLGFRTWRYVLLQKRIDVWAEEEKNQRKKFEGLENKYNYAVTQHDSQISYRQNDPKIRSLWNRWRQYTQRKIFNNINKERFQTWIFRGYGSQLLRFLKRKAQRKLTRRSKINGFIRRWEQIKLKTILGEISRIKQRRHSIDKLFVHKLCPFMMHKTFEDFFSRVKNYGYHQDILKKTDITNRIQFVIETFEKKRKSILNFYVRKWRRNEYQIRIERNLMKRLTRNAMNWRVKDLFFSWKLETEAKKVKQMHEEEGEVKKRRIEINRLKLFLEEFKKEKGLLLQDEGGQFVLSPRFQQKKDQQVKRDNNLRYKFISRLILSMNGYSAPVKAWNNFKMYMLLREKYRKFSKFIKNNLRKPDLCYAFRVWYKASQDFNKLFDTMERKGLIKILNRQKQKMQMQYTRKVNLEDKIHEQMRFHKVLSYQEDRKEKLCAMAFLKNLRKLKMYGLLTWKDRVRQMKEVELENLQQQGNTKINNLEEQVNQLSEAQMELRDNNVKLEQAVQQALDIAEMVKRITEERDLLSKLILEKQLTCENLQEENEELNAKLYQAQKEAMNLLILSGEKMGN